MKADQAIPWMTRADLQSVEMDSANIKHYSVKDPVKDEFYVFNSIEYFLLSKLKSRQSLQSLIQASAIELGRRIGISELQAYLHQLARDNLLVPNSLGDGRRLLQQNHREAQARWLQRALGLLSIRVGGFYPATLLKWLAPVGNLCFNPVSRALFVLAVIGTVLAAGLSVESLAARVPSWAELTNPGMLIAVLIGFCAAKIVHELAHALACQYVGRECSEMGLLLLVFLPCLYCDVSDVYTHKRKQRLLVTLAGVGAELGIAVICFWIWMTTLSGALHTFCYSLMLITSVNTVLLNGNPLMRYDGYYALSDFVGIPNLAALARQQFQERWGRLFWKQQPTIQWNSSNRFWWVYELLAKFYRIFILGAIGYGIWKFFDFHQLRSLGNGAVSLILTLALLPLLLASWRSIWSASRNPRNSWADLRWLNLLILGGLVLFIGYLVSGWQFSHRVWGPIRLQLAEPVHLFATAHGKFVPQVKDGQWVQAGDLIGRIESPELELEHLTLTGQLAETRLNLQSNQLKSDAIGLAGENEFWKLREATLQRQLAENESQRNALTLRSPKSGQLVAIEYQSDAVRPEQLSQKQGTLFDPENQSVQVKRGDPVGYIGTPTKLRGIMSVDQQDIELIEIGQQVKIAIPGESQSQLGQVIEIALEQDDSNRQTSAPSHTQADLVAYQVVVELEAMPGLQIDSQQSAVVLCQRTNLFQFVSRWIRNSFWF